MKRQIKFRGKTTVGGIWAYGSLLQREDTTTGIVHCEICNFLNWDVDPETVGQFTGLLDKDGKEIYEGDVLTHSYDNLLRWVVVFSSGGFGIINVAHDGYLFADYHRIDSEHFFTDRIITDNIHDNPELIK